MSSSRRLLMAFGCGGAERLKGNGGVNSSAVPLAGPIDRTRFAFVAGRVTPAGSGAKCGCDHFARNFSDWRQPKSGDTKPDPDAYTDQETDADAYQDRDANAKQDRDTYTDQDSRADPEQDCHTDPEQDRHANAEQDPGAYADQDSADCDADAEVNCGTGCGEGVSPGEQFSIGEGDGRISHRVGRQSVVADSAGRAWRFRPSGVEV
jgi:hypothetical protein